MKMDGKYIRKTNVVESMRFAGDKDTQWDLVFIWSLVGICWPHGLCYLRSTLDGGEIWMQKGVLDGS